TIKEIYVECGGPSEPCNLPGQTVDPDVDWDMWLGPAPWAPYHPYRISGSYNINGTSWRSWSDYSGGGMTDWGAHKFGGAMFAGNVRDQGPVEIIPPDGKDHKYLTYVFANGLKILHSPGRPNTNVTPVGTPGEKLPGKQIPTTKAKEVSTATSFTASRTPANGRSAILNSPTARRPFAIWAISLTN
ncbi:MAG TPA: hypothetical protein VKB78_08100, partial [Pirellulales bacterium]|nr:hypothetical protein [Pirellulales bacterium]